jgi:D-mannose binding lectin/PAN-like domain/S-locus glycoprotein domain
LPNHVLNENQTLVSLNGQFELGFFNPSSSTNQYLGIWYRFPNKTIVWVANNDNPISGGNGSLLLTQDGALLLQNVSGGIVWLRGRQSSIASPVTVLLDSGTLVINDTTTGEASWQSSYELSNTLLPQAYLGYIMLANLDIRMRLTSWNSETDPSIGSYVYMLDPHRLYELVIVKGGDVNFRTGPWNGSHWNGMPQSGADSLVAFKLKQTDGGAYFYYYQLNPAYVFRLVMNPTGNLSFLRSNQTSDWEEFQQIPPANSVPYASCGPYGAFNGTMCACLDAHIPKSLADWESGNFSQGCVRHEPFKCETATGFVNITNVKLPDTKNANGNSSILNLEDCKKWCTENCSCTALAILGSQGCVGWFGELIDTVKLVNDTGENLYIRVAGLPPPLPPVPPPLPPPLPSPVASAPGITVTH